MATVTATTGRQSSQHIGEGESSTGPKEESWCNWWTRSSFDMLRTLEKRILSYNKTPYWGRFVNIGRCVGEEDKIWTIGLNTDSPNTPLVLLHGLGAGVALWVLNLEELARERPVYAIDVLGFGRSSRPSFDNDAMVVEKQLVKSIEDWRREVDLNEMVLLGHSMGGFLAASYALSYPERLRHLIVADPWGFPEKPEDFESTVKIRTWVKPIIAVSKMLNPLWPIRVAGPYGASLVNRFRGDIVEKFTGTIADGTDISNYIHQCNAQRPTGEAAFHTMMKDFGWAKNPMIHRIVNVKPTVPITMLYGAQSWVMRTGPINTLKELRVGSYVNVQVIENSGHHIYADDAPSFNRLVNEACRATDDETRK
ncbi:(Lyso)-N-acylphosphatidylethanolamine lipase isoform X1 [Anopheles bellator]|uniref:(Lyso)-N-acylphosphatidylethanolamine lipase isoform X1 n=2 Tax=Anopheles bellator TaxID=139047 RepID=UPI002649D6F5|nr:(Lyso)-N-acylphosphatidylethanolamine lipase isoform X1 [Anopheles bellator]